MAPSEVKPEERGDDANGGKLDPGFGPDFEETTKKTQEEIENLRRKGEIADTRRGLTIMLEFIKDEIGKYNENIKKRLKPNKAKLAMQYQGKMVDFMLKKGGLDLMKEHLSDEAGGGFEEIQKDIRDSMKNDPKSPFTKEDLDLFNKKSPESKAYAEYAKSVKGTAFETLGNLIEDLNKKTSELNLKSIEGMNFSDALRSLKEQMGSIEDFSDAMEKKYGKKFIDNMYKNFLDSLKKGDIGETNPGDKPKNLGNLKKALKAILILAIIGTSIELLVSFLIAYAEEHSGCQIITCNQDEMPESNPVKCWGNTKTVNVFFPNSNYTNFNSAQCVCADPVGTKTTTVYSNCEPSCSDTACESGDGDIKKKGDYCSTPIPIDCGNPPCSKDWKTFTTPYIYYYWGIMTPFDALGNIASGVANGASKGFKWLEKFLIIGGIVIGCIVLLLAIMFYFKNKKSLSVKYPKAPSIPKEGIEMTNVFGNLSRYRNYGYMGKCLA